MNSTNLLLSVPRTLSQPSKRVVSSVGISSNEILQGQKTVEISHNGFTYRLQATRLGKLILTK